MIFEGLPNLWLYILIGTFTISSILLFFLSKYVIRQGRVKNNYEVERNTCKFCFLTERDQLIFLMVVNTLRDKDNVFKVYRNERKLMFVDKETAYGAKSVLDSYIKWNKMYKVDVSVKEEFLYIKYGE